MGDAGHVKMQKKGKSWWANDLRVTACMRRQRPCLGNDHSCKLGHVGIGLSVFGANLLHLGLILVSNKLGKKAGRDFCFNFIIGPVSDLNWAKKNGQVNGPRSLNDHGVRAQSKQRQ